MWQAEVYVTELRDWTKPLFRAEAFDEDPRTLLPFLLEKVCREPIIERMRYLNLQTDGLSVVLYLARADSQRNSSSRLPEGESPPQRTTKSGYVSPPSGRS